jgi:hypothetical protein
MPGLNRSEEPGYESNKTRKNYPRNHPPSLPRGVNPKPANHKDRQKIGESDRPEPPQAGAGQCSAGCKPRNAKTFHTLLSAPYFRSGFISSNSIIGHHVQLPFLRRRWTRTTGCACQRTVPARQPQETEIFTKSSGWPNCTKPAFSHRRSPRPTRPSFSPGCERRPLPLVPGHAWEWSIANRSSPPDWPPTQPPMMPHKIICARRARSGVIWAA